MMKRAEVRSAEITNAEMSSSDTARAASRVTTLSALPSPRAVRKPSSGVLKPSGCASKPTTFPPPSSAAEELS